MSLKSLSTSSSSATNSAPGESNVSDAGEPKSDEYVEMWSVMTDAVISHGKVGDHNALVTIIKPATTIRRHQNFGN